MKIYKKAAALLALCVTLGAALFLTDKNVMTAYAYTEEEKEAAKSWLSQNGYPPTMAGAEQAYQDYLNGKFGPVDPSLAPGGDTSQGQDETNTETGSETPPAQQSGEGGTETKPEGGAGEAGAETKPEGENAEAGAETKTESKSGDSDTDKKSEGKSGETDSKSNVTDKTGEADSKSKTTGKAGEADSESNANADTGISDSVAKANGAAESFGLNSNGEQTENNNTKTPGRKVINVILIMAAAAVCLAMIYSIMHFYTVRKKGENTELS